MFERDLRRHEKKDRRPGFSRNQILWVKRAYETVLGFDGCAFPVWDGQEYDYCRRGEEIEIHHVRPRGWCFDVLKINPNMPGNAVPLCPEHHRKGQRGKLLTRAEQEVIHLDAAYANRHYLPHQNPDIYQRLMVFRRKLMTLGKPYWYGLWDQYLLELAMDVTDEYRLLAPADIWPGSR